MSAQVTASYRHVIAGNDHTGDAYKLAMLAAQICPEFCAKSPKEAIKNARALLTLARVDILNREHEAAEQLPNAIAELRAKQLAEKLTEANRQLAEFQATYDLGIKIITSPRDGRLQRPYIARERFEKFIRTKEGRNTKAVLAYYKREGFTGTELVELQAKYSEWWIKTHKRAKQGRVADKENDARLRPRLPRELGRVIQAVAQEHGCTEIDVLDTFAKTGGSDSIRQRAKPPVLTKDDKAKIHAAAVKHGWKEKLSGSFAARNPIRHEKGDRGWTKDVERPLPASVKKGQRPDSMRATKGRSPLRTQGLG